MKTQYHIIVDTTDQHMAGTDSNIFIVLYGEHGTSDEIRINSIFKGNAFERNHLDEGDFYVNEDYGDIHKIRVRSDGMYAGSEWLCSYIKLQRIKVDGEKVNGPVMKFSFGPNNWLKGGDEKIFTATSQE